ncbi:unnamed protein product, partial [Ectocarpus fasciculatus]
SQSVHVCGHSSTSLPTRRCASTIRRGQGTAGTLAITDGNRYSNIRWTAVCVLPVSSFFFGIVLRVAWRHRVAGRVVNSPHGDRPSFAMVSQQQQSSGRCSNDQSRYGCVNLCSANLTTALPLHVLPVCSVLYFNLPT